MRKENFLKKIDLLTISLEVITLQYSDKNRVDKFKQLYYSLNNKQYDASQKFLFIMEQLYEIRRFIKETSIDFIATSIISSRNKENKSIQQYLLKFHYIYFKNKKYYLNYKSLFSEKTQKIAISENAILHLYIISEASKLGSMYRFIKYLKNDKIGIT